MTVLILDKAVRVEPNTVFSRAQIMGVFQIFIFYRYFSELFLFRKKKV